MKNVMIIFNLLALLLLPWVFYTAFELTEVTTRSKLLEADQAGVFNQEKLNNFTESTMAQTGYKSIGAFAYWLTNNRPWQSILIVPSVAFLILNTLTLLFIRRSESKQP